MADVRQPRGAKQGVADRVGKAVRIAVTAEAEVAVEPDAAEHKRTASDRAMNVIAVPDSQRHGRM